MIVITFSCLIATSAKSDPTEYFFLKKFQALKIKGMLKITAIKNHDVFFETLHQCIPEFYRDKIGVKDYYLEDRKKLNMIGVSEYVFKDTTSAGNAFRIAYNHAESVRKTPRKDFRKRCFDIPFPQIYYASKEGSHVFIYSEGYNFKFYHSGEDSVDTNMHTDKGILLDDLYREMTESE
jgi:hypothetical protein